MREEAQDQPEGLRIVGQVSIFSPPRGSYARAAHGGAQPDTQIATWLLVRPDGGATAYAGKVEYGQGIRSGLAMEVADELRLPLSAVEVVLGDTDQVPWDMGTFGSQSTARVGLQLRKAAATARQALLEMAADRLDLSAEDLECRDGLVVSQHNTNRAVGYGELAAGRSLTRDLIDDVPLTPADEFTVMGRAAQRVDAVARVTGQAQYSQDVLVPGMLFAKALRPPTYGARLADLDAPIAESLPGVVQVARDGDLVAVLAETDEQAELGAQLLRAQWEEQSDQLSQLDMPDPLLRTARDPFTTRRPARWTRASGRLTASWRRPTSSLTSPTCPWSPGLPWRTGTMSGSPSGRVPSAPSGYGRSSPNTLT